MRLGRINPIRGDFSLKGSDMKSKLVASTKDLQCLCFTSTQFIVHEKTKGTIETFRTVFADMY